MTITRLAIEGEYKENCLFAGLAVYSGDREDILFCSNRSFWNSNTTDRTTDTKHTISPSDNMSLVIYDIKNYTTVSAYLIFNLSTCNGITINPCEYMVYCGTRYRRSKICKTYLDTLTTANTQFKFTRLIVKQFESLHKILYEEVYLLTLKQKTDSCLQIYLSSSVPAREQNIFRDVHYHFFSERSCDITIVPKIDGLINEIGNFPLYASYEGKINRLEDFQASGIGRIISDLIDKYTQKQGKYTKIIIKGKGNNFYTKYRVLIRDDVIFRVATLSDIAHYKDITMNMKFFFRLKGGSYSTILVSLIHQVKVLNELGISSTLWQMFNTMSSRYSVPLITINSKHKTKQFLNLLTNFNPYGYSLHLEIRGRSFHSHIKKTVMAILKIQTRFCICKSPIKFSMSKPILNLKKCDTLMSSDILDTKGLFTEIYENHCTTKSTLDWSMKFHAFDLLKSKGLEVVLPGIYEKARVHMYYHNYSIERNEDQLKVEWQDKKILQIVNTSLLLNGKQYFILSETINQGKIYSWKEAKEICIKYESNLPILSRQSDIQDLVDIILRAAWTGPMRMIFIGLQVSIINTYLI